MWCRTMRNDGAEHNVLVHGRRKQTTWQVACLHDPGRRPPLAHAAVARRVPAPVLTVKDCMLLRSIQSSPRTCLHLLSCPRPALCTQQLPSAHIASLLAGRQQLRQSASNMAASMPDVKSCIDFLTLLQNLKNTKRTGWVRCNVAGPESIADHMYRMAMMSMLASGGSSSSCSSSAQTSGASQQGQQSGGSSAPPASPINSIHCMKMALVHDIAEAIVGDITPHCKVSDEEKFQLEQDAICQIKAMLGPHTAVAAEVEALWLEYEAQQTPESHLVKDFDKLEMILQAAEYEAAQGLQLQQFFDSTRGKFKTQLGREWAEEIVRRRPTGQQQEQQGQQQGQEQV